MQQDISIRTLSLSDLDQLQKISRNTFYQAFAWGNSEEDLLAYMNTAFSREQLIAEMNEPASTFFFAEIDKQVVGYLKLNVGNAQSDLQDEHSLEVSRIYIDPSFQGNGIGKLLLDKTKLEARHHKVDFIWLGVWEKNPGAIRFYERNGFVKYSTHPFMLGSDKQTDIIMKLVINAENK